MNPTKKQLIDFICANFTDSDDNYPTAAQLDGYKKDELLILIANAGAEKDLEAYISSLS